MSALNYFLLVLLVDAHQLLELVLLELVLLELVLLELVLFELVFKSLGLKAYFGL